MKKLDEILAYCDKATKGPYYVGHMSEEFDTCDVHESHQGLLVAETVRLTDFHFWNGARTDLPLVTEYAKKLEAENEKLRDALTALVKKTDEIITHPSYLSVFVTSSVHGCPYTGPTLGDSLDLAHAVLTAIRAKLEEKP